ncbi:hypothetical protein B0T16DRAFT_133719 [Cercophora newfieldiana]|uniref:Uncharacterized protein n=1 Tax=Cercophora newfieldiana TaxID=92897 RepID=A0AA40CUB8_9PEZI|nr:hypothetical protein B0T16DRAFT_133719 [Cercophora newfieldiana]
MSQTSSSYGGPQGALCFAARRRNRFSRTHQSRSGWANAAHCGIPATMLSPQLWGCTCWPANGGQWFPFSPRIGCHIAICRLNFLGASPTRGPPNPYHTKCPCPKASQGQSSHPYLARRVLGTANLDIHHAWSQIHQRGDRDVDPLDGPVISHPTKHHSHLSCAESLCGVHTRLPGQRVHWVSPGPVPAGYYYYLQRCRLTSGVRLPPGPYIPTSTPAPNPRQSRQPRRQQPFQVRTPVPSAAR